MAGLLRVLVIDDKPDFRAWVSRALENYSLRVDHQETLITFEVLPADDGLDYCKLLQKDPKVDIAILGQDVCKQSFCETLSQAACRCSDLAVLAVTSERQQAACLFSANIFYTDYWLSPVSENELRFSLTKAAEKLIRQRTLDNSSSKGQESPTSRTMTLLATAAHELKAPAAAIEGYLQIVLNKSAGDNPAFYDQMLQRCLVRSQAMRHLINDLLDLQAIRSGKKKRNLLPVDLMDSARAAIETAIPKAQKKTITLTLHGPENLNLLADRCEMDIIFNNLLSNAIKYNIENGKIDLTLEKRPDSTVIRIKDTGIGIAQQDQKKLFREFTRIKNEKTRDVSGTGLGLCIIKNIVELYQGTIDVRSTVNQGTIFTIRIPHV
jgi:signal transduction histidine kinase